MSHEQVNCLIMLCASVLMFAEALLALRRFRFPGGVSMCLALTVGGIESLCYAFVFLLDRGDTMIHLAAVYSVTGPVMGAFWFTFAARYARLRRLGRTWITVVLVGAALTLIVAVISRPGLIYPPHSALTAMDFAHINVAGSGVLFSIQLVWFYVLVLAGMVMLLGEALRSWDVFRGQAEAVIASIGIAFLLDVGFMAGYTPVRGLHLGLVVLAAAMLPLIWALPGLRASDYSAAWQRRILEGMSDAVLVTDDEGRIASANRAAQRLLTVESGRERMAPVLSDYPWLVELGEEIDDLDADAGLGATVTLPGATGDRHFDVRRSSLRGRGGRELSRVLVLHDVTERVETASELDDANSRLQSLVDASLEFGGSLNTADVLSVAARRMRELSGAGQCTIYRLKDGRAQELKTTRGTITADESEEGSFSLAQYNVSRSAVEAHEVVCVSDTRTDPRLSDLERSDAAQFGYRSSIDVPLVSEGTVVGLAVLTSAEPREYGPLTLLPSLAHNAAQALVNAEMVAELRQRAKRLALVSESGALFSSTLAVDDVLVTACRRLCDIADAPICSVYVLDEGALRCRAGVLDGEVDQVWMAQSFSLDLWPTTRLALESSKAVTVVDLDDARLGVEQRASMAERGEVSLLVVPLVARGEAFGVVELVDRRPRSYSPDEQTTVEAVCSAAALAIRNADAYSREQEHVARLASLLDASRAITSTVVLDRVLPLVAQKTCQAVHASECVIWEYDADADALFERSYFSSTGFDYTPSDRVELAADDTERRVILAGEACEEQLADPDLPPTIHAVMERWGEQTRLSVPLVFDGKPIGMLVLMELDKARHFRPDELELVQALAEEAAVVIQNARQYERLETTGKLLESQVELQQAVLELSGSLLSTLDGGDVFARIAELVQRVVANDNLEIRLVDREAGELYCAYASAEEDDYVKNWRSSLDAGVSGWVVQHKEAQLVNDMPGDPRVAVVPGTEADPQASIIVPLTVDGEVIGVLAIDRMEGRTFAEHELESARLFANLAAIAIRNAEQYQHVRAVYANNLRTLCIALNAKDHYTLGHTARVAAYMVLLGRQLGWSAEMVSRVGESAYLHDIGKIGIPDRVLTKPGKLNQREWEMMRGHPAMSAEIIKPLYEDEVVLGVRHHHERYDGRGYPDGLVGDDIPLVARAMCVADSYDAMSADRPYHRGLTYTKCLEELERCAGAQFDPVMVDAFRAVLAYVAERRQRALALARQAAALIDGDAHRALGAGGSEADPAYRETVAILRGVRDADPAVRFITTVARRGAGYEFVCDAEEDESLRSRLGDLVAFDPELVRAFEGADLDICLVAADQFGIWISAVAPVTDSAGDIVAVVNVDYPACDETAEDSLEGGAMSSALTALLEGSQERFDRVTVDAVTDTLTGLYNHRYLHEGLAKALEAAIDEAAEVSLVLCDVDHLERLNRELGHSQGDDALRVIGQLIDGAARATDICARFGGDEFAIVLAGMGGADAVARIEGVRAAVAAAGLGAEGGTLTLSAGVATFPWDGRSKDELIDAARRALAVAKNRGRDRCVGFASVVDAAESERAHDYLSMMADLADARMLYRERHSEAVARLARLLAMELGQTEHVADQIGQAARLRDVGQFTVPDEVLRKPGVLTSEEWDLIREHPTVGARLLRRMGMDSLADAVAYHHERFDGTGYPSALRGDQIPLAARIVAAASSFEAMLSSRPYREAHSLPDALDEMRRCTGTQFDPDVVSALERVMVAVRPDD
jgi:diguanylate cyclase (GGDEF)-like protein